MAAVVDFIRNFKNLCTSKSSAISVNVVFSFHSHSTSKQKSETALKALDALRQSSLRPRWSFAAGKLKGLRRSAATMAAAHRTNFRGKPQRNGASIPSARGERARLILHLTRFSAIPNQPFWRKVGKTTKNGVFGHLRVRTVPAFNSRNPTHLPPPHTH